MRRGTHIIGLLALVCACKGDDGGGYAGELMFEGSQDFLPGFEQDTGWLPADSPAAVRVVARGQGGLTARARATTNGSSLTPVAGSGELHSEGGLVLEISARVDASGVQFEDVVDSFEYTIDPSMTSFEPFLLDGEATVESSLPAAELASVPLPGVPGATLTVDVAGGTLTSTFSGSCAEAAGRVGQYTGVTTTTGTIDLQATIEVDLLIETLSFGPFDVPVEIPPLAGSIDLGALSLDTGEPVMDPLPCEGGVAGTGGGDNDPSDPSDPTDPTDPSDPTDPTDPTDPSTTGVDTGSTSLDPTTGSMTTGDTTGGEGACGPADECESAADCLMGEDCSSICTCYDIAECDDCIFDAQIEDGVCETEALICGSNPDCVDLSDCLFACVDSECIDQCYDDYPGGEVDFTALYVCIFGDDGLGGACGAVCT